MKGLLLVCLLFAPVLGKEFSSTIKAAELLSQMTLDEKLDMM